MAHCVKVAQITRSIPQTKLQQNQYNTAELRTYIYIHIAGRDPITRTAQTHRPKTPQSTPQIIINHQELFGKFTTGWTERSLINIKKSATTNSPFIIHYINILCMSWDAMFIISSTIIRSAARRCCGISEINFLKLESFKLSLKNLLSRHCFVFEFNFLPLVNVWELYPQTRSFIGNCCSFCSVSILGRRRNVRNQTKVVGIVLIVFEGGSFAVNLVRRSANNGVRSIKLLMRGDGLPNYHSCTTCDDYLWYLMDVLLLLFLRVA